MTTPPPVISGRVAPDIGPIFYIFQISIDTAQRLKPRLSLQPRQKRNLKKVTSHTTELLCVTPLQGPSLINVFKKALGDIGYGELVTS